MPAMPRAVLSGSGRALVRPSVKESEMANSPGRATSRRRVVTATAALLVLVAASARGDEQRVQSGTIRIEQVQIAFMGSGNLGGGTLSAGGRQYSFSVGGLGIGGMGVSKITATGEVYNMSDVRYFPGAYAQARYGLALGDVSTGDLWLQNGNGVLLHLKAERVGLALSLGADAVYIDLD
jgi:hypothetical protein